MLDVTATTTLLIEALSAGRNEAAWAEFVERYWPILLGLARAAGLREHDAEDAAQQTLAEFARDLGEGRYRRGQGRLRAWLIGIARHRIADAHRRDQRQRIEGGESRFVDLNDEPTVSRVWDDAERSTITERALIALRTRTRLSEASLKVFELTVVGKVPVAEVARQLGMSEDDVYVAKSRATSKLRELYAEIERTYREDA